MTVHEADAPVSATAAVVRLNADLTVVPLPRAGLDGRPLVVGGFVAHDSAPRFGELGSRAGGRSEHPRNLALWSLSLWTLPSLWVSNLSYSESPHNDPHAAQNEKLG